MFHRLKPGLKPGLKLAAAAFGLAALLAAPAVRADEPVVMPVPPQPTVMPAPESESTASPAMWTIEKPGGGTVTLFGSIHLLPRGLDWRTPAFEAAFAKADVVVFEMPVAEMATTEMQTFLAQSMMNPPGVTLSTLLDAEEKKVVETAASSLGASFAMLEPLRPWMVGLQLTVGLAVKQGFDPNSGVDKTVEAEAMAAGKTTAYFETAREQLELFTSMSSEEEIAFLVIGAREMIDNPDQLNEMIAAWAAGDTAAMDALMNEGLEGMPELGKRLLDDRNARWVEKITSAWMTDAKSYLIVVGAGPLAGEKGVPALLRARGIEVKGP